MKKRTHSGISMKRYVLTKEALRKYGCALPEDEAGELPPFSTTTDARTDETAE